MVRSVSHDIYCYHDRSFDCLEPLLDGLPLAVDTGCDYRRTATAHQTAVTA